MRSKYYEIENKINDVEDTAYRNQGVIDELYDQQEYLENHSQRKLKTAERNLGMKTGKQLVKLPTCTRNGKLLSNVLKISNSTLQLVEGGPIATLGGKYGQHCWRVIIGRAEDNAQIVELALPSNVEISTLCVMQKLDLALQGLNCHHERSLIRCHCCGAALLRNN